MLQDEIKRSALQFVRVNFFNHFFLVLAIFEFILFMTHSLVIEGHSENSWLRPDMSCLVSFKLNHVITSKSAS